MAAKKDDTVEAVKETVEKKIEMTPEEIKAMIQKAKDEALAEYRAQDTEKPKEKKTAQETEERVTIELFKDNDKYRDDLVVGVNGKYYQIQRGIPVSVPKSVAEVIANSKAQDSAAADYSKAKEQEYLQPSSELGV